MDRSRTVGALLVLLLFLMGLALMRRVPEVQPSALLSDCVCAALSARGINVVIDDIPQIVEQAFVKSVDPQSRFLTRSEAIDMQDEWPAVEYGEQWPFGMIYVKMLSVNEGAFSSLASVFSEATNQVTGLILDLRDAGGWSGEEIEKLASSAVSDSTPLCQIIAADGTRITELKSVGERVTPLGVPVVVLVNDKTSGAAEILAGSLSGQRGVALMGAPTAGMACLREFVALGRGNYLFIATGWARWGERDVEPIEPDIVVEDDIQREMVPEPGKTGRQSEELVALLKMTASDEVTRRATDLILSSSRLRTRAVE